ncbi:MAG: glycosyltransferase family 2 protein [Caldilineaceae bacterium]|nr:glycosyltransferase family 2 protein [Caldilineaceae bacterium]
MNATVIIPVWNGAAVILDCLASLYANSGDKLYEVICIDNGSVDESADQITHSYPQVRLVRQLVNLGFAGGVNVGLQQTQTDLAILLNQDCLVQPGWLDHMMDAFQQHPGWGIAGCTLLDEAGEVEHVAAYLAYPEIQGVHVRALLSQEPQDLSAPNAFGQETRNGKPYVTGALFAIRRAVWEEIGLLDERFYPAYYEETDYCFRARSAGYSIGSVPLAQAVHTRSSREWLRDPLLHWVNQELSRYRFICKHLSPEEIQAFAAYELQEIWESPYYDSILSKAVAARRTLRALSALFAQESAAGGEEYSTRYRLLQQNFRQIMHRAIVSAQRVSLVDLFERNKAWHELYQDETLSLSSLLAQLSPEYATPSTDQTGDDENDTPLQQIHHLLMQRTARWQEQEAALERLAQIAAEERELLERSCFTDVAPEQENLLRRFSRLACRVTSILSGREFVLRSRLDVLQTQRLNALQQFNVMRSQEEFVDQHTLEQLIGWLAQERQSMADARNRHLDILIQLHRRLQLIELLMDYDER